MGIKSLRLQMLTSCFRVMGLGATICDDEMVGNKGSIKLIRWDGKVEVYDRVVAVSEITKEFPKYLVCHSDSFCIGQKVPALSDKEQLQMGQTYFVLPSHFFQSVLSFVSIATSNYKSETSQRIETGDLAAVMTSMEGTGTGCEPGNSLPLYGRVAIVIGGSRGIGRAIATYIASLGANVVIGYAKNSALADEVASEINMSSFVGTHDIKAITAKINVAVPEDVKGIFDVAENTFGSKIHIMVNSAGIIDNKLPPLASTSIEEFDSTIAVNTRGAFLCCREAANRLVRGGGGRIVMISSSLVGALTPGYSGYAASKAAVETMVKIVAKELSGTSITANCVAPGPVATDLFLNGKSEELIKKMADACPLGRLGETKDIMGLVGLLVSDAGEWINGQVIRANGGFVI